MTDLNATIATAVLNAATPAGMISPGAIPESDADKITEAAKIIELALQTKNVADQVGRGNVPMWPHVEAVLRAAGQFNENGQEPSQASSAPPVPPAGGEEAPGGGPAESAPPAPASPTPPPVQPPAGLAPGQPQNQERWLDASGNAWDVLKSEGGPQIEARAVATNEVTVLPAGFLVQRAPAQPSPEPPSPSPSPPAQSALPSSSPPPSPPSEPAPPAPEVTSSEPSGAESQAPPSPSSPPSSSSSPPSGEPGERSQAQQFAAPIDDDEGDAEYGKLLDAVVSDYSPPAMPAPMDLETPPAAMPDDLTQISDVQARALHSQFNALASRARYLYGLEASKARACGRVRDAYLKAAIRVARVDAPKDATLTEVTYIAEKDNEDVITWTARVDRHADRADAYKTFLAFYSEDVTVLSRDWTMRDREEKGS